MLFFTCNKTKQQKPFWKVDASIFFFVEILEKPQQRISFFYIVASGRAKF